MMFFKHKPKKISLIDVDVLEATIENKFLIKRLYKKSSFEEFIVCSDYDFSSNTYNVGKCVFDVVLAYQLFNNFVSSNQLVLPQNSILEEES